MTKIAIITGGNSNERNISLISAENVDNVFYRMGSESDVFDFPKDIGLFLKNHDKYDLIFPCIHGKGGEDGEINAMANILGIKSIFDSISGHKMGLNKFVANTLVEQIGIVVPKSITVSNIDDFHNWNGNLDKFIVKPNSGGSSVDTEIFTNKNDAGRLIEKILTYDSVIIQNFVKAREITVSVYSVNDEIGILGITEIVHNREFFDIESKYDSRTQEITPADISDEVKDKIERMSMSIFERFGLKDFARIDFLLTNNEIHFLEVNTIPGMTASSIIPRACEKSKFEDFDGFIKAIVGNVIK